ncbi:adenylate/guanylate cyclase domain-containing protein [Herbiconiux liangxiaofengii]|uniref:adenylate/guanylate cyclase domain-containing protein n=1 Tax=Herbiconiux liangxiaofengii TaxID=3342795 RepID=UPI0035B983A9
MTSTPSGAGAGAAAETGHAAGAAAASSAPARRRRGGLSIQSKLLIMLLSVSVGSTLLVGAVGYVSGTDSLRDAAFDELTNVREARSLAVKTLFENVTDTLVLESKGQTAVNAAKQFTAGFDALEAGTSTAEQRATVDAYYSDVFVPAYEARSGQDTEPSLFTPRTTAQIALQSLYTAPFTDYDAAAALDDAGDGSAWSAANAEYNPYFRDAAERFGYEDMLILDTEGNVVYSVYKGVDLGTNVLDGPYAGSSLAGAYTEALTSNTLDYVGLTDFERYQPSLDIPTAWGTSPLGDGDGVVGVLAVQFPLSVLNTTMTAGGNWQAEGLGETGESYLVGPDQLMRSVSRSVLEHPDDYAQQAISAGTPVATAERIAEVQGTVLLQPVRSQAVERGLKGETGTIVETNYLGHEVLTAYTPVPIEGIDWVVVASIDTAEAFAPVADFARNLVLTIAGILVLVSLLSLVLAQVFARPVRGLVTAVRRVAGGELGVEVPQRSRDEFGDLAYAFNDMSRTLQLKQDLLDAQRSENERLLRTLMPDAVAERYRGGEDTIALVHDDVAVLFADIVGFDDFVAGLSPDAEVRHLNELLRGFDDAAERTGIERVRTLREGYLASCGLVVPRVDNARRMIDFAVEMERVLARFNVTNGTSLALRAGIDSGPVTSGLVGRTNVAYDMWGEAVSLAGRVQGGQATAGVFVTDRVRETMADALVFEAADTVDTGSGSEPVWKLVQE